MTDHAKTILTTRSSQDRFNVGSGLDVEIAVATSPSDAANVNVAFAVVAEDPVTVCVVCVQQFCANRTTTDHLDYVGQHRTFQSFALFRSTISLSAYALSALALRAYALLLQPRYQRALRAKRDVANASTNSASATGQRSSDRVASATKRLVVLVGRDCQNQNCDDQQKPAHLTSNRSFAFRSTSSLAARYVQRLALDATRCTCKR